MSLKIVRKKRSWRKKIEKFSIAETQGRKNEWKDSKKGKIYKTVILSNKTKWFYSTLIVI